MTCDPKGKGDEEKVGQSWTGGWGFELLCLVPNPLGWQGAYHKNGETKVLGGKGGVKVDAKIVQVLQVALRVSLRRHLLSRPANMRRLLPFPPLPVHLRRQRKRVHGVPRVLGVKKMQQ